jgi:hypothetical protein
MSGAFKADVASSVHFMARFMEHTEFLKLVLTSGINTHLQNKLMNRTFTAPVLRLLGQFQAKWAEEN